jgi:hypothetical protein
MPFALIGAIIAFRFRNELPSATRRYLAEVEQKRVGRLKETVKLAP